VTAWMIKFNTPSASGSHSSDADPNGVPPQFSYLLICIGRGSSFASRTGGGDVLIRDEWEQSARNEIGRQSQSAARGTRD